MTHVMYVMHVQRVCLYTWQNLDTVGAERPEDMSMREGVGWEGRHAKPRGLQCIVMVEEGKPQPSGKVGNGIDIRTQQLNLATRMACSVSGPAWLAYHTCEHVQVDRRWGGVGAHTVSGSLGWQRPYLAQMQHIHMLVCVDKSLHV